MSTRNQNPFATSKIEEPDLEGKFNLSSFLDGKSSPAQSSASVQARIAASKKEISYENLLKAFGEYGIRTTPPIHLEPPRGCRTFDLRRNARLTNPTLSATLVDFTIPDGYFAIWRSYSLYSDVAVGITAEFLMTVNDNPVFPYHGNTENSFKKDLALSPDLSEEIDALLELKEGDNIKIVGTVSANPVSVNIAARAKGWLIIKSDEELRNLGG